MQNLGRQSYLWSKKFMRIRKVKLKDFVRGIWIECSGPVINKVFRCPNIEENANSKLMEGVDA